MSQNYQYNTIEEALRDLKEGKIVLVTDDPDRENEGDLICAAEFATRENINFMATYAKGLICTPMSAEIAVRLNFPPMVAENTDNHSTAFTVAVDHADTTTGISAEERSYTIMHRNQRIKTYHGRFLFAQPERWRRCEQGQSHAPRPWCCGTALPPSAFSSRR